MTVIQAWGFYLFTTESYARTAGDLTHAQCQDAFDQWTDLMAKTEGWGFDGLSFAEHHFMTAAIAPSPHLVIANLAARTKRLKFTTLGAVLGMHNVSRYIAECGMLDHLTHGRFEPGIGPGSGPREAMMSGIPEPEVRPRYESGLAMLQKSFEDTYVTHKDDFYNVDKLGILPRWQQRPGQSVWVTVMHPYSAAQTAKRGWKLCTAWLPTAVAVQVADAYRAGAAEAGLAPDPSMLGIRRRVFVADSDAEAQEKFAQAENLMPFLLHKSEGSQMEAGDERIMALVNQPDDYVIGSPKTVAEKLISQCQAGGFGTAMAWADFAGFRWADLNRSHELFGTKVAPVLHSADVGALKQAA
jgi:alkanesulfonate monooxygenase SsuD/methylene tetrahydromethanopterin reductase-like flavin-dependent oxidoreductase (luciferase family)